MSTAIKYSFIEPDNIMLKTDFSLSGQNIVDVASSIDGIDDAVDNMFYGKKNGLAGFYTVEGGGGSSDMLLNSLLDVTITGSVNGDALIYENGYYINKKVNYDDLANTPSLSGVALSGSYDDLSNKPVIPVVPTSINDLSDVDTSGITSGQVLQYNGTNFVAATVSSGGANSLDALTDVTLFGLATNDVLQYNGTIFVNKKLNYSTLSGLPTIPSSINDLAGVDTSGVILGQVLQYDGANFVPVTMSTGGGGTGGAESLNDLLDVTISTPTTGQVVRYNGTKFVNSSISYNELGDKPDLKTVATTGKYTDLTELPTIPTSVNDLSDIDTTGVTTGQVLQYDGTKFIPTSVTGEGGGATTLNDLLDVDTTGVTNGQMIQYDAAETKWKAVTPPMASGATIERFKIKYTGGDMAAGSAGLSNAYSDYSDRVTPVLLSNQTIADFITEITFTGYQYPPASIMYYGFDAHYNRYEIRTMSSLSSMQYVYNESGTSVNPQSFGNFQKMRLSTSVHDTGASPKTGLPAIPGHAWVIMVMQG